VRLARLRAAAVPLALIVALAVPAIATPPLDRGLPTNELLRVFAEPLASVDYVQISRAPVTGTSQYLDGLAELERRHPEVIEVTPIGEVVGEIPGLEEPLSAGGREIPVITVTDRSVPDEGKTDLYISMSIHGLERAGLEGGVRYIEDLGRAWSADPDGMLLTNGDPDGPFYTELTLREALGRARLVFVNLNPDGWAAGDTVAGGPSFKRGNDGGPNGKALLGGIDLNRQWPTLGWHNSGGLQYETGSQPEARLGRALIEDVLGVPAGSADLHGQFNSDALLAMMFPAGQFDPAFLEQQVQLAEAIKHNVNTSILPGAAGLLDGRTVQPAEYYTAFDAIGYDDAGFQGDYLVQQGSLNLDHEYIFSNLVPNTAYSPVLTQVHVDTTRELLEATLVTTIIRDEITYTADLGGRVGYVDNPEVLRHTDEGVPTPPFRLAQAPYTSTSMQYWHDLARYADEGASVEPLSALEVADPGVDLSAYDTIVVTDRRTPTAEADGTIVAVDGPFWQRLRDFAEDGGNVVLTDEALAGLGPMGVVGEQQVRRTTQNAGRIRNIDRNHPLLDGVGGVVGQTYFEVPLGFSFSAAESPTWSVNRTAWTSAGGSVAATAASTSDVTLGSLPLGEGRVTVFGAILPTASQRRAHTHGLADYAVTYAGNAILVNALTWTR
jgi:hypothetical protein